MEKSAPESSTKRRQHLRYIVALTAAAASIAACGSEASPPTASSPTPKAAAPAPKPATTANTPNRPNRPNRPAPKPVVSRCLNSKLKIELGKANGAAGSSYMPLEFTNVGSMACWLVGYPGVSAWNDGQIGEAAVRDRSVMSSKVTLSPGASASASLRIINADNYPARCQPENAEDLKVYPPESYGSQLVPHRFTACASSVELLVIRPVVGNTVR